MEHAPILTYGQTNTGAECEMMSAIEMHASTKTKYIIPSFIAGTAVATISVLFAGSLGVTEGGARPAVRGSTRVSLLKGQVTFLKLCLLVVCLALIIPRFTLF